MSKIISFKLVWDTSGCLARFVLFWKFHADVTEHITYHSLMLLIIDKDLYIMTSMHTQANEIMLKWHFKEWLIVYAWFNSQESLLQSTTIELLVIWNEIKIQTAALVKRLSVACFKFGIEENTEDRLFCVLQIFCIFWMDLESVWNLWLHIKKKRWTRRQLQVAALFSWNV